MNKEPYKRTVDVIVFFATFAYLYWLFGYSFLELAQGQNILGILLVYAALLFLFSWFIAKKLNSYLPNVILINLEAIKWAAKFGGGFFLVFSSIIRLKDPSLDSQMYTVIASLFLPFAIFADIPMKPSESEIESLKKELAKEKNEKERLNKTVEEIAINLSKSSNNKFERGLAEMGLGNLNKALEFFQMATVENKPILDKQAEIFFYEGLALCNLGRPEEGIAALNQSISFKPDYLTWYNKGVALGIL